ncbi:MAG: CBS domain-containing protein [Dokdonella sp.]|uniref:CBS domain-containing protein n=1 Tax=Dokdonella sp. TaxID=2291710 RepID=UPI0025B82AF6|nr:CBS domain-containing protein [Dokdonella sp.]MBX3700098.1 CBS domain-containing protein [Dokdonella sp.]
MQRIDVSVEEFTTPDPITVREDTGIEELRRLMDQHGIRHLPVLRDGRVVGVVSDRDVRAVVGLSVAEKLQVCASDIMADDPLTVSARASLDEVAYAMAQRKVGSAIVTEANGRFLGIFTASDALNALIEIARGEGAAGA